MLWKIFFLFFKINLFSPSGPASYGLAEKLLVPEILSQTKYQQIVAISANIPGSDAIQLAWQVGFHAAHIKGAVIAILGALTPCIVLVSFLMVILRFIPQAMVDKFFVGVKPILFLFLIQTAIQMFIPNGGVTIKSIVILCAGGMLLFFKMPIVVVLLIAGFVSVIL